MAESVVWDEYDRACAASLKRLRCEGAIALAEAMNQAIAGYRAKWNAAKAKGEVYEVLGASAELRQLLREAAVRVLEEPKKEPRKLGAGKVGNGRAS